MVRYRQNGELASSLRQAGFETTGSIFCFCCHWVSGTGGGVGGRNAAAFLLLSPNIWLHGTLNPVSVPWLLGEDKGVPFLSFS